MNFLCPACRTPLPRSATEGIVPCTRCGVQVDLTRLDTAPGTARLWPDLDLVGESLGPYQLTKRLAAGGMGVVYEAQGPQGPCAVKVLSALLAAEPELRTRFRREAAALRAIEHPGVVRILAEGEERGFCWYSMERVAGPDLRARIGERALPAPEVEALARRMLETLAEVHGRGFVHRDIKPGNILLAPTGPKLCDFGIARFDGSSTLTESAAVLGSLRYMAPEQRLGRTDERSDLYALGVVLHEALARGVPGEAELPPRVPARLRRLITRLLAERPIERPQTARQALAVLDSRRPSAPIIGAGAAAMLAVGVGIAWLAARGPSTLDEGSSSAVTTKTSPTAKKETKAVNGQFKPAEPVANGAATQGNDDGVDKKGLTLIEKDQALSEIQALQGNGVKGASTKSEKDIKGNDTKVASQVIQAKDGAVGVPLSNGIGDGNGADLNSLGTKGAPQATSGGKDAFPGKPTPRTKGQVAKDDEQLTDMDIKKKFLMARKQAKLEAERTAEEAAKLKREPSNAKPSMPPKGSKKLAPPEDGKEVSSKNMEPAEQPAKVVTKEDAPPPQADNSSVAPAQAPSKEALPANQDDQAQQQAAPKLTKKVKYQKQAPQDTTPAPTAGN
jgi:serine/threonine protein kinase